MRFIHTADIHLGVTPDAGKAYSAGRGDEIWDAFSRLIDYVKEEEIELLLIAGDFFHREPLIRELKEVSYLFDQIPDTKVVFTAGNHDYIRKNSAYERFEWGDNVFPILSAEPEELYFEDLDLKICGMSYHSREIAEPVFQNMQASGDVGCEILMIHGGDEKHIPVDWANLRGLGYDYVAMGHIHKPQAPIPGYAAYAGSLEPTDIHDFGQHGFIQGEITEDSVEVEFVPFASRRYIQETVKVSPRESEREIADRIAELIREKGTENLYELELVGFTDPEAELHPEMWDPFGNIIRMTDHTRKQLDYDNLYRRNSGNLLGRFLESLADEAADDTFANEVREIGTLALLSAMRDKL
jgi:YD repeat-containing protein